MNIAIDIGNSSIKYGKFDNANLIDSGNIFDIKDIKNLVKSPERTSVIFSSVAELPDLKPLIGKFKKIEVLTKDTPLPFELDYQTPETLGVDRIAAAAGAKSLNENSNSLIIDFGTCITYDIMEKGSVFKGGIISPGKDLRYKSMHTFTHSLPDLSSEFIDDVSIPGKTTKDSMHAGVILGIIYEIEGVIREYSKKYDDLTTYMCGGYAEYFERRIKDGIFVDSNLVLKGLNYILSYNREDNG